LSPKEIHQLKDAVALLEVPGLLIKLSGAVGVPIEKLLSSLPAGASDRIARVTQKAVEVTLTAALKTLRDRDGRTAHRSSANLMHKAAVAATGATGGAFGLAALAIELPISTTIMMRSIADIARSEGAHLDDAETQLECIQVLTLGGLNSKDDTADLGYLAARQALASSVSEATKYLAASGLKRAVNRQAAPQLVRFITQVSQRFSIQVSNKAAAQMIPVIGAAGGAAINTVFITHFQKMAKGHFTIRRLERLYGDSPVHDKYLQYRQELLQKR